MNEMSNVRAIPWFSAPMSNKYYRNKPTRNSAKKMNTTTITTPQQHCSCFYFRCGASDGCVAILKNLNPCANINIWHIAWPNTLSIFSVWMHSYRRNRRFFFVWINRMYALELYLFFFWEKSVLFWIGQTFFVFIRNNLIFFQPVLTALNGALGAVYL